MEPTLSTKAKVLTKTNGSKLDAPTGKIDLQSLQCYVCDKNPSNDDYKLLLDAHLSTTSISVAQTIGKLLGQNCMVLVAETDIICIHCFYLFNEMDRLEFELTNITRNVIQFLKAKYDLNKLTTNPLINNIAENLRNSKISDSAELKRLEITRQLSELYGTPVTVNNVEGNKSKKKITHKVHPFKCPVCRLGFDEQKLLRAHVMEAHLSKFHCGQCQENFESKELLGKHSCDSKKIHKKFKCAICLLRFRTKDLLNGHLRKHRAAFFRCGSCGETFQKRELLMKHLQLHTTKKSDKLIEAPQATPDQPEPHPPKEIKFLDCQTCSLTFIDSDHYASHLNSAAHKKLDVKTETTPPQIELETIIEKLHSDNMAKKDDPFNDPNKTFLYKCLGCSALYDNTDDLQLHILTTGHVDFNSEIQILSVENENNENIQFITTSDATGEIKLITFHNEDENHFEYNNEKEINELLNVVVTAASEPSVSTPSENRPKVCILDEKTIDLSQFINTNDGIKNGFEMQSFQLNQLCNSLAMGNIMSTGMNVKSESHNQQESNSISKIQVEPQILNLDQHVLYTPTTAASKIFKCCKCDFQCLSHEIIKTHMSKHNKDNLTTAASQKMETIVQETASASQFFSNNSLDMVLEQDPHES